MTSLPSLTRMSLGALILALGVASCSSAEKPAQTPVAQNGPAWIDRPQSVFDEGSNVVIQAVGLAADNPNPAIRRQMAITRARQELAATMGTLVQGMVVSYMDTNRDFYDMDSASSTEYYQDITRQVTQEMLVGSKAVDAWRDPITNDYYVLMRIDLDDVISSYKSKMNGAYEREATRKRIKANAMDFQKQMDGQLDKLNGMDADAIQDEFLSGDG